LSKDFVHTHTQCSLGQDLYTDMTFCDIDLRMTYTLTAERWHLLWFS